MAESVEVKTAKVKREWHQIRYPYGPMGETEPPAPYVPPPDKQPPDKWS